MIRSKAWHQAVRRAVAFIALLGVIAMPAEATSPDLGDGGAGPAKSLATAVDQGTATHHEHGPSSSHTPAPGHSTHVEHCGHSHVFTRATLPSTSAETAPPVVALSGLTSIPDSVPQSPAQRPPIA
ncbi:MAG: hypothetical protein ACYC5V_04855 [Gemmatimonadaceae bacterium]